MGQVSVTPVGPSLHTALGFTYFLLLPLLLFARLARGLLDYPLSAHSCSPLRPQHTRFGQRKSMKRPISLGMLLHVLMPLCSQRTSPGPTGAQAVSAAHGPRARQGVSRSESSVGVSARVRSAACRDAPAQGSFAPCARA